jgi:hypothetical protein
MKVLNQTATARVLKPGAMLDESTGDAGLRETGFAPAKSTG